MDYNVEGSYSLNHSVSTYDYCGRRVRRDIMRRKVVIDFHGKSLREKILFRRQINGRRETALSRSLNA